MLGPLLVAQEQEVLAVDLDPGPAVLWVQLCLIQPLRGGRASSWKQRLGNALHLHSLSPPWTVSLIGRPRLVLSAPAPGMLAHSPSCAWVWHSALGTLVCVHW